MTIKVINGPYKGRTGVLLGLDYKSTTADAQVLDRAGLVQFRISNTITVKVRMLSEDKELILPLEDVEEISLDLLNNMEVKQV